MLEVVLGLISVGACVLCGYFGYRVYNLKKYANRITKHNVHQNNEIFKQTEAINNISKQLQVKDASLEAQKLQIDDLYNKIKYLEGNQSHIESLRKSSETRLGLMAENFMPFIRDYPYDHKDFRFLGNPIDGIQIDHDTDSVILIEFKTGGARLSKSQKYIKDIVALGNVRFETFRVNDKGTSLKIESEMEEGFTTDKNF